MALSMLPVGLVLVGVAVPALRPRQRSVLGGMSSAIEHAIATLQQGVREASGGLALAGPDARGALSVAELTRGR